MKKILLSLLIISFLWLQFRLWWGAGGFGENQKLRVEILDIENSLNAKQQVNLALRKDIENLKIGTEVLEELARERLGLIKPDEHFFRVIHTNTNKKKGHE